MSLIHGDIDSMPEEQRQRAAAGLSEILVELGQPSQPISDWWNLIAFPELEGRTPTQAWLAGHGNEVRDVIQSMYSASVSAQQRCARNPAFAQMIARHNQAAH